MTCSTSMLVMRRSASFAGRRGRSPIRGSARGRRGVERSHRRAECFVGVAGERDPNAAWTAALSSARRTSGAWSDGFGPLRKSRSIPHARQRPASGALTSARSIRRPRLAVEVALPVVPPRVAAARRDAGRGRRRRAPRRRHRGDARALRRRDVRRADERGGVVDVEVGGATFMSPATTSGAPRSSPAPDGHRVEELRASRRTSRRADRAAVGHVDAGDAHAADRRLDPARLVVAPLAGQPAGRVLDRERRRARGSRRPPSGRPSGARRHSRPRQLGLGERRRLALRLLQADDSGACSASSSSTRGSRTFSELTFQVTSFTGGAKGTHAA